MIKHYTNISYVYMFLDLMPLCYSRGSRPQASEAMLLYMQLPQRLQE